MAKFKISYLWDYFLGNYRYYLYYSKIGMGIDLSWFIRLHIHQQIDYRIDSMNRECYASGSCIKCGCQTTALQMADRACDGQCYPKMMGEQKWKFIKSGGHIKEGNLLWAIFIDKFIKEEADEQLEDKI